jgi:flavodoxin
MNTTRTLIICESSHHGNTRKVAEFMASCIDGQVVGADSVLMEDLATRELVGFGSGIYYDSHSAKLIRLADKLPSGPRRVFLFSTAGLPILSRRFHNRLRRTLQSRGCEIVTSIS